MGMESENGAEQCYTVHFGRVDFCPFGCATTLVDRTYRPSLYSQLPQKLVSYLLVQVPDVARCFLIAILCMLTDEVGSNTSCDTATGRGHACEVSSLQNRYRLVQPSATPSLNCGRRPGTLCTAALAVLVAAPQRAKQRETWIFHRGCTSAVI